MAEEQAPSVGRIVHYHDGIGEPMAAIVSHVDDGKVSLTVFPVGSMPFPVQGVQHETRAPDVEGAIYWRWPPRV